MSDVTTRMVTAEEYEGLSFQDQGYVSYVQAVRNTGVPERCPYMAGSRQAAKWHEGQMIACIDMQEVDS